MYLCLVHRVHDSIVHAILLTMFSYISGRPGTGDLVSRQSKQWPDVNARQGPMLVTVLCQLYKMSYHMSEIHFFVD